MNKNIDTSYFFVLLLLFVGLFAVGYIYNIQNTERDKETLLFSEFHWEERVTTVGPDRAYDELIQSAKNLPLGKQHELVHVFGAALYNGKDLNLLLVCDEQFLYGCFHEFIGSTIAEHGLHVIEEIDAICSKAEGGNKTVCHHGVGHGIQTYLGYKEEDLVSALKVCDGFPLSDPIGGCYGGVFMEYNLRTMLGGDDEIRSLTENILSPCDHIEEKYQASCMFRLPQWWRHHLSENVSKEITSQLGEMCSTAILPNMVSPCFQGIGNIVAVNVNFDMAQIIPLCDASTSDLDYTVACRIQALVTKGFASGISVQDTSRVCRALPLENKKTCETQVNIVVTSLKDPK
ncbi:hypothetical protein HQ403_01890 [Candidatus Kaiserbacteria bacterium]|nr:hypothetical protein [Candidatus Kaiserbacteria bacterium]